MLVFSLNNEIKYEDLYKKMVFVIIVCAAIDYFGTINKEL